MVTLHAARTLLKFHTRAHTQVEDQLAACLLYPLSSAATTVAAAAPVWAAGPGGFLELARAGANVTLSGALVRLPPGAYALRAVAYGQSLSGPLAAGLPPPVVELTLEEAASGRANDPAYTVARAYSASVPAAALPLVGAGSAVSASMVLSRWQPAAGGVGGGAYAPVARCEVGAAQPQSPAQLNAAAPSAPATAAATAGFCKLSPLAAAAARFPGFTGTLLFSSDGGGGVHVQARVCGLAGGGAYPLRMMQYGDLRALDPAATTAAAVAGGAAQAALAAGEGVAAAVVSAGGVAVNMGTVTVDALQVCPARPGPGSEPACAAGCPSRRGDSSHDGPG